MSSIKEMMANIHDPVSLLRLIMEEAMDNYDQNLRCVAPAVIKSFDATKQTVSVYLVTDEIRKKGNEYVSYRHDIITDLPIVIPSCTNFHVTFPIKEGDECLVCFSDSDIDAWWQNGLPEGWQDRKVAMNQPASPRHHELSDGFAILGVKSLPNVITDYNADALEIRNKLSTTRIQLKDDAIKIRRGAAATDDPATDNYIEVTDDGIKASISTDKYIEVTDDGIKASISTDKYIEMNNSGTTVSTGSTITIKLESDAVTLTMGASSVKINSDGVVITGAKVDLSGSSGLNELIDSRLINLYNAHTHLVAGVTSGSDSVTSAVPLVPLLAANCATTKTKAA